MDKPGFELGCEIDFGHHDQYLSERVAVKHLLDCLQEYLGFATSCRAKQQKWPL